MGPKLKGTPAPKRAKRKRGTTSTALAHEQQFRRREVSRYRACGMTMPEIAHRLGVHVQTIAADMRVIEEQWFQHTMQDQSKLIAREVEQLETMRAEALRCFYEAANFKGEINQTGYLASYARLTERLHALLRLGDPQSKQLGANTQVVDLIKVVVKTRAEAQELTSNGTYDVDKLRTLLRARGSG